MNRNCPRTRCLVSGIPKPPLTATLTHSRLFQSELYFCERRAPLLAVCAVAVASYNTDAAIADAGYALLPSISVADLEQRMVDECLEVAALVVRLSRMLLQTRSVTTQSFSSGGGGGGNVDAEINSKDGSSSSCSTGKDETIELASSSIPTSICDFASPVFAEFHQQRRAAELVSLNRQRLEMSESPSSSSSSSSADASDCNSDHRDRYWAWHSDHRQRLTDEANEASHGNDDVRSDVEEANTAAAVHGDEEDHFFGVSERGAQHAAMRMHLLMRLAFDSHTDVLIAMAEARLALSATAGRERARPPRVPHCGGISAVPFSTILPSASIVIVPAASESSSSESAPAPSFALVLPAIPESISPTSSLVAPALADIVSSSSTSSSSSSGLGGSSFASALDASAVAPVTGRAVPWLLSPDSNAVDRGADGR
jgi:hypothetical protein